jgi:hypothetical protein
VTEAEDLKGRTCATCACAYMVDTPRIQTNLDVRVASPVPPPTLVLCRLNPPELLMTPDGPRLQQRQTFGYMSCWSWREQGTLPGDDFPQISRMHPAWRAS